MFRFGYHLASYLPKIDFGKRHANKLPLLYSIAPYLCPGFPFDRSTIRLQLSGLDYLDIATQYLPLLASSAPGRITTLSPLRERRGNIGGTLPV
jgi:hypothetical protein